MSKQIKQIRKVLAILLSAAMLFSVLLTGNVFVNAEADNSLPEGVSVTDGYGDTVELSMEFADEGNSLKLNAHGTADSHLAGFVLEGDRGDFYGTGISFWLKGPDTNTWGAVAMRSTDSNGNVKWFKTIGQFDNPAYIMDQGDGSAFIKNIDYSSFYETSDWRTGKPNGTEATPSDADIANFDAIIISVYMWGGWSDKTAYLDTVTVLGKKEAVFAENVVLADFEGSAEVPSKVTLGAADYDSYEVVTGEFGEGNALKVTGRYIGKRNVPVLVSTAVGGLYGDGVSFKMKGQYETGWGTVALRATYPDGTTKWFKAKYWDSHYGNPASPDFYSDANPTITVKYANLCETNDWVGGFGTGAAPTDYDIANFDMIGIGYFMWDGWSDSSFYLDDITVLNHTQPIINSANVVLADFEGSTTVPANVTLGASDYDSYEVVTGEFGEGNALKVTGRYIGKRNVPVLVSTAVGGLYGDGVSFKMKGQYETGWGTVALRATYPDGTTKWFKAKYWDSHSGNPASPYFYNDSAPTITFKYADLCETNDWVGGFGTGVAPTDYDIAHFDMIGIGYFMWDGWSDSSFYLDDITVLNHTAAPEFDDNVLDFDDTTALPSNIYSSLAEFNPIELSNEFAQSGNSIKLSTIGLGASYLTGIVIEGEKGDFNKGGISFWLKGPDVGAWGAVAVRTTDAEGNVKWFKNSSHMGNPATILNADTSTDTVNVYMDYSVLCECANNDWVWDAPDWNTAAKMTETDIANIDAVAIGVFIWGDWGAKTTYIDSISYKAPSVKTDSDAIGVDTIVYDFGDTVVAGDADGNGEVDIRDLVCIKKYLAKVSDEIKLESADIDGVDGVDVKDLIAVRKMLLA